MNAEQETQDTGWKVEFSSQAKKQKDNLPGKIDDILSALVTEIRVEGPVQTEWHHYGKLAGADDVHHCHLNKGKPRYVAVWKVMNRTVRLVEIKYVGTHEKVRYNKFK
ncbi:MAG: cytotoxic translational repressor of toxin-antitoxin stability system [Desulfovibrio sp.]|jgi:mRNA-degrading endonuclease RelE of RelBE toxin-antitoxin system|nr:cytotoxic translational repressor of toxin-antitoxin stability system [Desulfovibrio sp.]